MTRYYFDLIQGDFVCADDEGVLLRTMVDVEREAIRSLGDIARDTGESVAVEVRDDAGLVMRCVLQLELMRKAA